MSGWNDSGPRQLWNSLYSQFLSLQYSHIFFLEKVWDKSLESQAISRAWRMGATESVEVETLIAEKSIEETMAALERELYDQSNSGSEGVEGIQSLAEETEIAIQGGLGPRPLLSVPHLLSDEASAYYHGYTLAEMSVYQTRSFFLDRDGYIVDNPSVGPTLTKAYWKCGNSRPFLEIVRELTGKDLTADAWIAVLNETVEDKVARERKEYDEVVAKGAATTTAPLDEILNMKVRFVDGDEVIADSTATEGGILGACQVFEEFVAKRVAAASG